MKPGENVSRKTDGHKCRNVFRNLPPTIYGSTIKGLKIKLLSQLEMIKYVDFTI